MKRHHSHFMALGQGRFDKLVTRERDPGCRTHASFILCFSMISAQDSLNALVAASAKFVGDVDYVASCVGAWKVTLPGIATEGANAAQFIAWASNLRVVLAAGQEMEVTCVDTIRRIWEVLQPSVLASTAEPGRAAILEPQDTVRGLRALEHLLTARQRIKAVVVDIQSLINEMENEGDGGLATEPSAHDVLSDLLARLRMA